MAINKLAELQFEDLPPSNIKEYMEYESTLEKEFTFICQQLNKLNIILESNNNEIIMSDSVHYNFSKNYIEGLAKINIYSAIGDNIYLLDKLKKVQLHMLRQHKSSI